jgi:hypothetical protein
MFSEWAIKAMNGNTAEDVQTCDNCGEVLYSFWLKHEKRVCFTCKDLEICENCGDMGEGYASWGGWCHDCDNFFHKP